MKDLLKDIIWKVRQPDHRCGWCANARSCLVVRLHVAGSHEAVLVCRRGTCLRREGMEIVLMGEARVLSEETDMKAMVSTAANQ